MIKIAFPTDDGQVISSHLGQARFFRIITIENGQTQQTELREKMQHQHGDHHEDPSLGVQDHPGQVMLASIADCQALIAGGMGEPAYQRAASMGLQVYLTSEKSIDAAIAAYLSGSLTSDSRRIHHH
jgi:predicted Fe-Mo cluster-binding NifX family protein